MNPEVGRFHLISVVETKWERLGIVSIGKGMIDMLANIIHILFPMCNVDHFIITFVHCVLYGKPAALRTVA